jgi:transposase InsO family protein
MAMPWKECHHVMERSVFIKKLLNGDKMSDLCREFGVSRKTGYKFLERYQKLGEVGLMDLSRRPDRIARATSPITLQLILEARRAHPTWGAAKIGEVLRRKNPNLRIPVRSTIHEILDKHGFVKKRGRARHKACPTELRQASQPNDLWCADFKGQFRLGNSVYCYPLTITDQVSRKLLCCEALESNREVETLQGFEMTFREHGLPSAMRTDNGTPFSSRSLLGLSRLAIWWLKLGIEIERIKPGHPEQNGRHERMHRTLKEDTTRPARNNLLQQQEAFDEFMETFNAQRPHEALEMRTPDSVYVPSARKYPDPVPEPEYPLHDRSCYVCRSGAVYMGRHGHFPLTPLLGGERVGLREVEEKLWLVSFAGLDLGHYDEREGCFVRASLS